MTTLTCGLGPFRQRNFTLAWTAGLISMAGDWALRIALPILVFQLTGSIAATSGVVIAGVVPALLVGPLAGVFVDRWDRRRVMVTANLLQAAVLLPLLAVRDGGDVWIVYAVTAVATGISQFFRPAETALVPMLVDSGQLLAANALGAVNNNLARLAGPALGGVIAAVAGLPGVVAADATTFLVSAALLLFIRGRYVAERAEPKPEADADRRAEEPAAKRHPIGKLRRELTDGLGVIRGSRVLLVLVTTFTVTSIGEGIMGTLFVVYVKDALHGGVKEVGWLMSAQAVGGILGGLLGGIVASRYSPVRLMCVGAILFGAIDIALFTYPMLLPVLWPGLVFLVLVGIPGVIMSSAAVSEMQLAASPAFCGRVFAVLGTSQGLAAALGAVLAGAFGDRFGVIPILVGQGVGYVLAGVAMGVLLRGHGVSGVASSRSTSSESPSELSPASVAD